MRVTSLIALVMTATPLLPLHGQGWIEVPRHRGTVPDVVKLRSAVRATVDGRVAHIEVEEWFENRGGRMAEGDYIYPLPGEAIFDNFSLFQGDVELRGETMDAQTARRIYEEIVRRKRDPALIELVGRGMVRARVFPINSGETRKITLRYTQVLPRAGNALEFRYLVPGRGTFANRRSPVTPLEATTLTLTVDDGAAFRNPFSPTHAVDVERHAGRLEVRADDLEGDFALLMPLASERVGVSVLTHRPSPGEPGYFMLTLSPGTAEGRTIPRDIAVAFDVSGSMSGEKLAQGKAALRQLLESLRPDDRLRLIAFSNDVRTPHHEWTRMAAGARDDALRWIDNLVADGGTNIDAALQEAFRVESSDERLTIVLFLTDGLPSIGEQDPDRIAERARRHRGSARVFAFGVGYDVNTVLLDRLTEEGRGATQYVQPGEAVEQAVGTLSRKIQHPVLTDLTFVDGRDQLHEIYPGTIPDLFSGEELILFGRYDGGERQVEIRMRGRRGNEVERFGTAVTFAAHEPGHAFVARLWAARKLGHLVRTIRLEGRSEALIEEIRRTATRYGLLSEFTSYLVQEPDVLADDRARPVPMSRALGANAQRAAGAASPGAVSGRQAVQRAEQARRAREATFAGDLDAAPSEERSAEGQVIRTVAGRRFVLRDGTWTDTAHDGTQRVIEIEAFSPGHFQVLEALPELESWLREFDDVLIAGAELSIRVGPNGLDRLGAPAVERLVEAFRGH